MSSNPVLLVEPGTEFTGRRAVVTGGTRGIGRAIADRLRAGGASVLVAARTMPDDLPADSVVIADVGTAEGAASFGREALERSAVSTSWCTTPVAPTRWTGALWP